ncbi:MAG: hypothetical protein KGJ07_00805 [Patescibacteria group bacterium]|nr:hypothetical protein [Patescibacteria group bacterium]
MSIPNRNVIQRGQAFLVVVLVMVVALTVGLSIASRTLTNVRLTTEEVTSQRAFSAAEAGIEQLVAKYGLDASQNQSISNIILDLGTNTQIAQANISPVDFTDVTGALYPYQLVLNNSAPIAQDDGYDIWLTPFNTDPSQLYLTPWTGTLVISWGDASANTCSATVSQNYRAAIEVIVIYNSRTNPKVAKYAFDPCTDINPTRPSVNHFTPVSGAGGPYVVNGRSFLYQVPISVTAGLIARVIPVYASAVVGASASTLLPAQGQIVVASGVSGTAAQIKRQISYFQAWNALPSEYYHALFVR